MTWALHLRLTLEEANARLAFVDVLGMAEQDGRTTVYLSRRHDDLAVEGEWERVEERDWAEAWKAGLGPVTAGGFTIVPPWLAAGGADELVLEPGQAFGTGHHETTTGCLDALRRVGVAGRRVLDVGTGTGVLAIAAARQGAREVVAVDVDPLAVAAATDNARRNRARVDVRLGSVDAAAGRFDVVVANLDTSTLGRVAAQLRAALAPGGVLVASGVSRERQGEAVSALRAAGLRVDTHPGREWVVLLASLDPESTRDPG